MRLERSLLLSLALTTVACGDDGITTVTDGSTGGSTGTTTDATTTNPTTSTTGTPTTGPDDTTETTTAQGTTTDDPGTSGSTTAVTAETGDTTSGTTTDGTTTNGTTTDGTTTDGTTGTGETTDGTTGTTGTTDGTTGTTGDTDTMGATDDEIYEIQNGTIAEASMVKVEGVIVTGISATKTGMFVQEPGGGQFSGVWVFVGKLGPKIDTLAVGDEVDITGVTLEFNQLTEIDASLGTVTATGVKGLTVDPELLPIDTFADAVTAEPWEAVHVGVVGLPLDLTEVMGGVEYTLSDAGGDIVIDDLLYASFMDKLAFPQIGVGASFDAASGPLNQSGPAYKIAPRTSADLEGYMPPQNPQQGVEDLKAGDLVISEVMYNPTCNNDDCEWIEVFNASAAAIDLNGLIIQDDQQNKNNQGVINKSVVVAPGGYAVLGYKTMVTWPYPSPPAAFYGANPAFGNGVNGDQVFLKNSTITLDAMPKWLSQAGKDSGYSFKVAPDKLNSVDNDLLVNWCYSTVVFYTNPMMVTEKGSPGAVNEAACAVL